MRSLLLVVSLLYSLNLFAGYKVGNGGHVLLCGEKVMFYDTYFLENYYKADYSKYASFDNYRVILYKQLSVFKSFFPKEGNEFIALNKKKNDIFQFSKSIKPTDTTDLATPYSIPVACELKQLAYQYFDKELGRKIVVVDPDLFGLLSETDKAAFIFHEYSYYLFNYPDAVNVRRLVHIFLSLVRYNYSEIFQGRDSLVELGLNSINYLEFPLSLDNDITLYENSRLKEAVLKKNTVIGVLSRQVMTGRSNIIKLHRSGAIAEISYSKIKDEHDFLTTDYGRYPMPKIFGRISFYDMSRVRSVRGARGFDKNRLFDLPESCIEKREILFTPDGKFESCR